MVFETIRFGVTFWLRMTLWFAVLSSNVTESRLKKRLSPPPSDQLGVALTFQLLLMLPTHVLSAPEPVMFRLRIVFPERN